jgi:prepilin-type N-terminal cleavage/methylation domain-containing protein
VNNRAIDAFQSLPRRSSTKAGFSLSVFSTSAFTLIEMIVVMLIIATLAALVTTAGSNMFDRARKVQAKNDVTQLVTAISAFYTEYGKVPGHPYEHNH